MSVFSHLFHSLRETFPARASEWALAGMLFGWAIVLSSNSSLFADNHSYASMQTLMEQQTWAWLCLVAGGGRLIFLAINGAWRRTPHLRAFTAFISCGFWFLITWGLISVGTGGTGLAVYPILFALDAFNVIRAMGDAGSADRFYRETHRDELDS